MDSLKEFLETSTIHGLNYISSSPSKLSKGFPPKLLAFKLFCWLNEFPMHISSGLALLESLLQEKWSKGATFYHFARAPEKSGSKTRLNKPHSNSSRWNCEAQSVAVIVELCEVAPLKVLCCRLLRGKWGRGDRVGDGGLKRAFDKFI